MHYRQLKELREENNLKQREIAARLHFSQQVYINDKNGQRDIPTDILIQLSKIYNVSTEYILEISNERTLPGDTPD